MSKDKKDFSKHIVNMRFSEVYEHLYDNKLIRGKSDIAKQLGTYNHVIHSILKGQRNITVEQLNRLFAIYGLNANYLFGLDNNMFSNRIQTHSNSEIDWSGRNNITLVTERAVAGYALEHQNREYLKKLQQFAIPSYDGQLIAFEISGDSMMPTISHNDVVICEPLDRGVAINDNQVYVVVTSSVVAKRVQAIKEGNDIVQIRLISDNPMFKPYTLDASEIRQLLLVKGRLTNYGLR